MMVQLKHDTNNCFASLREKKEAVVSLPLPVSPAWQYWLYIKWNHKPLYSKKVIPRPSQDEKVMGIKHHCISLHQRLHFTDRSFIIVAASRPPVKVDRATGGSGRLRATYSPGTGYGTCGTKKAFWLHGWKGSKGWNLLDKCSSTTPSTTREVHWH